MPFRTTPRGEKRSSTPSFPVRCWSSMDYACVSSGSLSVSQNCAPRSARHSGLPQTCRALDTSWNFRGATMAPQCSRTGVVGPVPKGRWRLFLDESSLWTKPGRAHMNQTWNSNQMNGSIPVFLEQIKCSLHNVLWRWCSLWRMTLMG